VQVSISLPRVFTGKKDYWVSRPFLLDDHWWSVRVALTNSDLQLYSVSLEYFKLKDPASISLASLKSMLHLEPQSDQQAADVSTDDTDFSSPSHWLASYAHRPASNLKPQNRSMLSLLDRVTLPQVLPLKASLDSSEAAATPRFVVAREGESYLVGSLQLPATAASHSIRLTIASNRLATKMATDLFYQAAARLKKHKAADVSELAWLPLADFEALLKVYRILHGDIEQEVALLVADWGSLASPSESQPRGLLRLHASSHRSHQLARSRRFNRQGPARELPLQVGLGRSRQAHIEETNSEQRTRSLTQKSPRYLDVRTFSVSLKPTSQDSFEQQTAGKKLQYLVSSLVGLQSLQPLFGRAEEDSEAGCGENRKRSESIRSTRTDTDQGGHSKLLSSFHKHKRAEDSLLEVKSRRKRLLDERLQSIKSRLFGH